jgi:hypothetical protein
MSVMIHEFFPEIYPFRLWVSIFDNNDEESDEGAYNKRYTAGREGNDMKPLKLGESDGVTYFVTEREGLMKRGVLIVFNGKQGASPQNIAHEATHAARLIWDFLGEDVTGEEADAYLVGWIVKCVGEALSDDNDEYRKTN